MKIGTITFHWATNYGAVLQAYALQQHLKLNHYDTEIINYIPIRVKIKQTIACLKTLKVAELIKENRFRKFRKECLVLSNETYYSNRSLNNKCLNYDACICGSDQVWNEWFALFAEGKPTLSYYLNFVKSGTLRISYATSFGTNKLSKEAMEILKPELEKFTKISVREKEGITILENMGIKSTLVVDPTLLLDSNMYIELFACKNIQKSFPLFSYILHENQSTAEQAKEYIFNKYFDARLDKKYNNQPVGIYEWLYNIKNTRLVLTNSFHGAIFSILFHKPFIVIPVQASNMNDRITTLLSSTGLENRMLFDYNENEMDRIMQETIDWVQVDRKVKQLKKDSVDFLETALAGNDTNVV